MIDFVRTELEEKISKNNQGKTILRDKLTIKVNETPTGSLRFVLQEDNRFILQQEWRVVNTHGLIDGKTRWENIPVVLAKDVIGWQNVKLPKKLFTKGKKTVE